MIASIFRKIAGPLAALTLAGSLFASFAPRAGAAYFAPMSPPEYQFLAMVNADRAANGLATLAADTTLSGLAHQRSQGMVASGAFSHYDASGKLIFAGMLNSAGFSYALAGENIAENNYPSLGQSLSVANTEFMNSPTHRANILNSNFNEVGIGIAGPDGSGRFYITELFAQA